MQDKDYLCRNLRNHGWSGVSEAILMYLVIGNVASAGTLVLTQFGSAGMGGDDTAVLQRAINSTAATFDILEVPASSQPYNVGPLTLPSNAHLKLDPGVLIQARSGFGTNQQLVTVDNAQNVTIESVPGTTEFRMRKAEYRSGEYRHCLTIWNSQNVNIQGIACNQSGGDGIYIGGGVSRSVTVTNSRFDGNARNAMSVISVNGLLVDHCSFTNTAGSGGLAAYGPWHGIDVEPNVPGDQLSNITVRNSTVSGNWGNGILVQLTNLSQGSAPVSIVVDNIDSSSNHGSGFVAWNEHDNVTPASVPGTVTFQNSTSTNDANYGAAAIFYDATGALARFTNIRIVNPNSSQQNMDGAAFAVKRGGGDPNPMGNVAVSGLSVIDTTGRVQNYVTVEDYSHSGLRNISFDNFGQLSLAQPVSAIGVLSERLVSSIAIP